MALDFQQVHQQVKQLGENAPQREQRRQALREGARQSLAFYARQWAALRERVELAVKHDPNLRCALPCQLTTSEPEALDQGFPLPALPPRASILAADGSQIALDRHAEVQYCLINFGAIMMEHGSAQPPVTRVESQLLYDEQLYTPTGTLTDATLALLRDLNERKMLAKWAVQVPPPVVTFTDGPIELWAGRETGSEASSEFQEKLKEYLQALNQLLEMRVATAGYVDKPAANPVLRLLEIIALPESMLEDVRRQHPLRGVSDLDLFDALLKPGERSAVFAMQSPTARLYRDQLAIHFFYLNVGSYEKPHLARIEVPAWVVENRQLLDVLQAVLVAQCHTLGSKPYPYLLHRAHETAVVSLQERDQVTQMIALELRRRGVFLRGTSNKQALKDQPGRMRYEK